MEPLASNSNATFVQGQPRTDRSPSRRLELVSANRLTSGQVALHDADQAVRSSSVQA